MECPRCGASIAGLAALDRLEARIAEVERERDEANEAHRLINLGWNDAMARVLELEAALRRIQASVALEFYAGSRSQTAAIARAALQQAEAPSLEDLSATGEQAAS
jgi:hypothetical protein